MTARLLLVEDNAADANLLMTLLRDTPFRGEVAWVRDGEQALDFLFQRGAHLYSQPVQGLILDLGLPKLSGREVLETLRSEERFRDLPVVILSSSSMSTDIFKCHQLGISGYLTKPSDLSDYHSMAVRLASQFAPAPEIG